MSQILHHHDLGEKTIYAKNCKFLVKFIKYANKTF